jgi:diguanylate cyclase (GGDEF)-like protein/PAS domain S-box-containing protein
MTPLEAIDSFEALQTIIDVVPTPIFVKDREHRWVLVNETMCTFMGLPRERLIGKSDFDVVPAEQAEVFWTVDDRVFDTGEETQNEEELTDRDGNVRTILTTKRLVRLGDNVPLLVAVINDITDFRQAEAHSRYLALHDALSGLANRTLLNERADYELARIAVDGPQCALFYVDLDGFKAINDRHGHRAGDEVIREFANRLAAIFRAEEDTVARIGGDEFSVLVSDVADIATLERLCVRVIEAAAVPFDVAGMKAQLGASVGVVLASGPDCRYTDLLRKADVALYNAKADGRGCYRVYNEAMDEQRRSRALIESDLRRALAEDDGLQLFYQPLYANTDERLTCVEALVRWQHRTLGFLGATQFVPVAEEAGLIGALGEWVLRRACTTLKRWPGIALAVNFSPIQLRDPTLASRVLRVVEECGFDPRRLQIEITENTLFNADGVVACSLRDLRAAGVGIALDDFGTGFSSLTHLRRLEVDKVKIDRSFVQHLGQSEDSAAIVEAVASIGRTLGLTVAAEGVETPDQRAFLAATGCTELQGYFFSRPLCEAEIAALLDRESNLRQVA